jgi:hypothetical protein
MHKLRSAGILQRLNNNIDSKPPENEAPLDISMDFTSVAPIFVILAVGVIGAILMFLLETAVYKMRTSSMKKLH